MQKSGQIPFNSFKLLLIVLFPLILETESMSLYLGFILIFLSSFLPCFNFFILLVFKLILYRMYFASFLEPVLLWDFLCWIYYHRVSGEHWDCIRPCGRRRTLLRIRWFSPFSTLVARPRGFPTGGDISEDDSCLCLHKWIAFIVLMCVILSSLLPSRL